MNSDSMNSDRGITQLIKVHPVVTTSDSVRRAAGLIKGSDGSRLIVVNGGAVVGTVSEQAIVDFLSTAGDVESAMKLPVDALVEPQPVFINSGVTLKEAAQVFASTGADTLPVIGSHGMVQGVLYRSDVIGSLTRTLRPPTIAGMATPLGVYLTTGSQCGGAGSAGLFLTGVSMMLMIAASTLIVNSLPGVIARSMHINIGAFMASMPILLQPHLRDLVFYASTGLTVVIMLFMLHLSPLSGYHAAGA